MVQDNFIEAVNVSTFNIHYYAKHATLLDLTRHDFFTLSLSFKNVWKPYICQ